MPPKITSVQLRHRQIVARLEKRKRWHLGNQRSRLNLSRDFALLAWCYRRAATPSLVRTRFTASEMWPFPLHGRDGFHPVPFIVFLFCCMRWDWLRDGVDPVLTRESGRGRLIGDAVEVVLTVCAWVRHLGQGRVSPRPKGCLSHCTHGRDGFHPVLYYRLSLLPHAMELDQGRGGSLPSIG